jgi:phospholipid/cholesterol/gamma-HCH transport system ATP-binding protein
VTTGGGGGGDTWRARKVRAAIRAELRSDDSQARSDRGAATGAGLVEHMASPARRRDAPPGETAVIALEHVSLAFERPVLEDVSLEAYRGETVVIVGESGTGKSTILKLVLRLLIPDTGRVLSNGRDIVTLSFDEALAERQHMGMVFQGAALFDSMSVYENVAYPLREHTTMSEDEIEARVREKLQFVDLDPDHVMACLPAELSGGMKKRVGIARGLANDPVIMLYDEPTSGLDPLTTGTITRLIMKLQRELHVTSLVVSHDIRSANRMGSHIAVLADHQVVFFGTPEEMAASEDRYLRDFLGGL